MKVRYKVHSVGPLQREVAVDLPGGLKGKATATGSVVELLDEGAGHGTVTLAFWGPLPWAAGESVEATFEKVG